ncbi:MAG TPA: glycoside hydrolase family 38 C-terminal domain-containing protein, partial [Phycisphaeraceae bacterium]
ACAAQVSLVHDGPMQTTFRIRTAMHVPEAFDPATRRRSQRRVEMIVDTCLTLRAQARHLELDITVHNTAQDHRLRALFPSGAAGATTCWSDTPFDVVQRPIGLRPGYEAYRELEVETRPQQSWTAVCDGQAGLAVIADGLYEAAVMDLPDRPIALTLFRATGRTVFTDGEPGGQLQGPLRFRCWLTPLTGSVPAVELCRLGQRISAGLRAVAVDGASADADRNITLPATMSFLRVRGDAVLSSCRFFEDAIRLRLYNPTSSEATAQIESPLLPGKEAPVAVHLRPRQILSTTLGG